MHKLIRFVWRFVKTTGFILLFIVITISSLAILAYKTGTTHYYVRKFGLIALRPFINGRIDVQAIEGDFYSYIRIKGFKAYYYRSLRHPFISTKDIEIYWKPYESY